MKASTHGILQTLLTLLQGLNLADVQGYVTFLPPKWSAVAMFGLTTIQAGLGLYSHYFNPNGTSASLPDPSVK
jgi:hypothetical protein